MPAPKTIVPSGYNIDLDRQPPSAGGAGCSGTMVMAVSLLFALIGGGIMLARSVLGAASPTPTPNPTLPVFSSTNTPVPEQPTVTQIDDWSATGTALYFQNFNPTNTPDYCFWLTPTATPSPTLPYTPDAWQATGTAIYEATYPPVTSTPTPDYPRVWCNNIPTNTPTMTPLSLEQPAQTSEAFPTFTPTMTPLSLGMIPTFAQPVEQQPVTQQQQPAPVEWNIVLPTVGPPYTVEMTNTPRPPRPTQTPWVIVVTATPTNTLTPEITPELTPELTPEITPDA